MFSSLSATLPRWTRFACLLSSLCCFGLTQARAQFSAGFGIGAGNTGQAGVQTDAGFGATAPGNAGLFNGTTTFGNVGLGGNTGAGLGGAGGVGGLGGIGGVGGLGGGLGGFGLGFGIAQGASRGGFGGANQFNMQQQGQQGETTIRASIKLGFSVPRPSGTARAEAIATRLSRIPLNADLSGVNLLVSGDTVVLSGSIDDPDSARLIERLMLLEPGIYNVQNELQVVSNTPAAPSDTRVRNAEVVPVPVPIENP